MNIPGLTCPGVISEVKYAAKKAAYRKAEGLSKELASMDIAKKLESFVGGKGYLIQNVVSDEGLLINFAVQIDKQCQPVRFHSLESVGEESLPSYKPVYKVVDTDLDGGDHDAAAVQRIAVVVLGDPDCRLNSGEPLGRAVMHLLLLSNSGWTVAAVSQISFWSSA